MFVCARLCGLTSQTQKNDYDYLLAPQFQHTGKKKIYNFQELDIMVF